MSNHRHVESSPGSNHRHDKCTQDHWRTCPFDFAEAIVVILDPRLRTKPYGLVFLASLPKCWQTVERR
jgi:hypothetical protein